MRFGFEVKVAKRDLAATWQTERADLGNVQGSTSIVLAPDGRPSVSHYDAAHGNGVLKLARKTP
jgi:hypothetical protein